MKPLFILITFLAATSQAQISFRSYPMCSSWSYSNGAYACTSYPMSEYIPDQYSLNNKIQNLEARIRALEKALALQLQLQQQPSN
jgi:hypothetical protein